MMKRAQLFAVIASIALLAAGFIVWDAWQSRADSSDILRRPMPSSYRHVESFYGPVTDPFDEPTDVAVLPAGEVAVADSGNGRVVILDSSGKIARVIGVGGKAPLRLPTKVVLDGETILVVDPVIGEVRRYSLDGEFASTLTRWSDGRVPSAVAVDSSGRVYVADVTGHVVSVLDPDGHELSVLGRQRPPAGFPDMRLEDGRLDYPNGVAIDGSGRVWVADSNNGRMQIFDLETGTAVSPPLPSDDSVPPMSLPRDVAIGGDGTAFVADPLSHRVFVLNQSGQATGSFGTMGISEGELFLPVGVAVDDRSRVFVAEKGSNRISVFAVPILGNAISFVAPPRVALPLALILGALVIAGALLLPRKRLVLGEGAGDSAASVGPFGQQRGAALSIDLSKCFECRACEKACLAAHGAARFQMDDGNQVGDTWNPRACRQCSGQSCVSACPVDAMYIDERGVAVVGTGCIGCGGCAKACPFDGIQMVQIGGKQRPAKCDLCFGRPAPACASACPTAAFMVRDPGASVRLVGSVAPCPV